MSENKITNLISSQKFLWVFSAAFFFLSIFFRSIIDIGADTGIYLDLGKKISDGGKYYYDFFEGNFPLSFYFYALEYKASNYLNVSPIIFSEIAVNLLALISIFWSAKILMRSTIYENKAHFNLILISFFLGFFLRPIALANGEFGTKTSFLLILLYPYIAYSFERKIAFTKSDLLWRGCLMGLLPCLKPHYLIFVIFIEARNFWKKKSIKFFFEADKLFMLFLGATYLLLMLKFTPEFFEFIVPMWQKYYPAYGSIGGFFENLIRISGARILPLSFIFIVFSRIKFDENNKILLTFFLAAVTLIILENISTVDQIAVLYSVSTICFFKIIYDLFCSEKITFAENKFIILGLIFLPIFDLEVLPAAIFGLGGFINAGWLLALAYPFFVVKKLDQNQRKKYFPRKNIFVIATIFLVLAGLNGAVLIMFGGWNFVACNLSILILALIYFDKKIHAKISSTFSLFFVFVVFSSVSFLLYAYINSAVSLASRTSVNASPHKLSDAVNYYSKTYAPKKDEGILVVSNLIAHQFPALNYLEKNNYSKLHLMTLDASSKTVGKNFLLSMADHDNFFTNSYLFEDFRRQVANPKIKIILINNGLEALETNNSCLIGYLEYYFLDAEFKKIFFQNFRFENNLKITHKVKPPTKIAGKKKTAFDLLEPSTIKILHEFEIYVRKEK